MNVRLQNILILAIAAALITLPHWTRAFGLGAGSSKIESVEGRRLAPVPSLNSILDGDLADGLRDVDAALEDNLWHRADVIAAMSRIGAPIGQSVSEKVVIGKEGWLFNDRKILLNALDPNRDNTRRIEAVRRSLLSLQNQLEERDIPLLLVLVPSKRTVFSKYLPEWARLENQTRSYKEIAKSLSNDFDVIDLYEPLSEANSIHPTYYKTDSHWNEWGAFVAFQEIIARLPSGSTPRPTPQMRDFDILIDPYNQGDFARMLYQAGALTELVPTVKPRFATRILSEEQRQDYPASWGWSRIVRSQSGNPARVMVLGDSFSLWLEPYFGEFFDLSVRTMHQRGRFDPCLLEEIKPDVVIFEISEQRVSAGFQEPSACITSTQ